MVTMVSHIPFKNQKPFIDIPPIHVTTELLTCTNSSGAGHFYIDLVDIRNMGPKERITADASTPTRTMSNMHPFGPQWSCIHGIAAALILGRASMDAEKSLSK